MATHHAQATIAFAMGDASGVGAELMARVLNDPEVAGAARYIVIGDRRVLARGEAATGQTVTLPVVGPDATLPADRSVFVDVGHLDPADAPVGTVNLASGRFALENFRTALLLAAAGEADAVAFTPFNKAAMRLAHPPYEDEIGFTADVLGFDGTAKEFNILEGLWNARVTSHVPLKDVAALITAEEIIDNLGLTEDALRNAGIATPRIAVAGLNPHAGDGGNFGREEIDVIAPAVEAAKARGIGCDGPFPADTVFLRATRGDFDAVLTMYHDQGQIAMKLIGFDKGVTLLGGFPFPICTPAHGTAHDIAGTGKANTGATRAALLLAARMATAAPRERPAAPQSVHAIRSARKAA
ncbi:4-hydroxythreonine-4-phosphate dehydrogenase PdxA [Elioraea sp.]|uniref:4-hydroxythreonine-4-phosphate dehydrogenase PdxA n=1 Tax=Elioraea sp. TaxID=2185103 RepID=UPI0025BD1A4F|nr:4-hydroxythreonine-4-phosphate dehydrogenase PdxA [Elioraea sp.]